VITAATGAEAMANLTADLYAVSSDHDLGPGPGGRAVLEEARRRAPGALLISGRPRTLHDGEDELWHAMLVKPISSADFLAELRPRQAM
jgi:hypothetical protein